MSLVKPSSTLSPSRSSLANFLPRSPAQDPLLAEQDLSHHAADANDADGRGLAELLASLAEARVAAPEPDAIAAPVAPALARPVAGLPDALATGGPAENGTAAGVVAVGPSGDLKIDGLIAGMKWNTNRLNYSDPDARADYGAGYNEPLDTLQRLNADQLQTLHFALNTTTYNPGGPQSGTFSIEAFTALGITYTSGGSGGAIMRFANTSTPNTAYAFVPANNDPRAGDAFFGGAGRLPTTGDYDYLTVLHEVGHTLGLKHSQDNTGFGAVPAAFDSMEYTIMSYRSYAGQPLTGYTNEFYGYAQTYMMLDIAALQHIYGANFGTNAGNTVYSWGEGDGSTYVNGVLSLDPGDNRIFMTIWDGGGNDTYDLSNYATNLRIDLEPGSHSLLSSVQIANLGAGHRAQGNVYNALQYHGDARSLIENAFGGAGNDVILGNDGHNILGGGDGNDEIYGGLGNDIVDGGSGNDILDGGPGNDDLTGGAGNDTLDGGSGDDQMGGAAGNDTYEVDSLAEFIYEFAGQGVDTVLSTVVHTLGDNFENLTLIGAFATGGIGNGLANTMTGNQFGNTLRGAGGNDTLLGLAGDDFLRGEAGNDVLTGGAGVDVLIGGAGNDVFRCVAISESPPTARDIVRAGDGATAFQGAGAAAGDRFDFAVIDANTGASGNQAFVFGGGTGTGRLWLTNSGGNTLINGNNDRDSAIDFQLLIEDGAVLASAYSTADFFL